MRTLLAMLFLTMHFVYPARSIAHANTIEVSHYCDSQEAAKTVAIEKARNNLGSYYSRFASYGCEIDDPESVGYVIYETMFRVENRWVKFVAFSFTEDQDEVFYTWRIY